MNYDVSFPLQSNQLPSALCMMFHSLCHGFVAIQFQTIQAFVELNIWQQVKIKNQNKRRNMELKSRVSVSIVQEEEEIV